MIKFESVSKWFSGKALKEAEAAFAILLESVAQGFWVKGGGLKVTARLDKQNVAKKWAKPVEKQFDKIGERPSPYAAQGHKELVTYATPAERRGWHIAHYLMYGSFQHAQGVDFAALRDEVANGPHGADTKATLNALLDYAEGWAKDWAPIAAAIAKLDATKPKPVFTSLGVSPTITGTLAALGFDTGIAIEVPQFETYEVELEVKGRKVFVTKVRIIWPEGTVHNQSHHAGGNHCHACGHAIKNPYNWCPLIIRSAKDGVPRSMWVGQDCALSVFRIKKSGDLDLEDGQR